jgi:hypothetical protein
MKSKQPTASADHLQLFSYLSPREAVWHLPIPARPSGCGKRETWREGWFDPLTRGPPPAALSSRGGTALDGEERILNWPRESALPFPRL